MSTATGTLVPPLTAIAGPQVIMVGTDPDFETILRVLDIEDKYYDLMAEQDLELTLAQAGMPS